MQHGHCKVLARGFMIYQAAGVGTAFFSPGEDSMGITTYRDPTLFKPTVGHLKKLG